MPGLEGFVSARAVTLNPSYYIWPALEGFQRADGDAAWGKVLSDGDALLSGAHFGIYGLPTDWLDVTGHDAVEPAMGRPARFGFDAMRVPLYALAGHRPGLARGPRDFWQKALAGGKPIPAWIDVVTGETAPFAISPGGRAIAGRLLGTPVPATLAPNYYAAALQMLARELP